MDMPNRYNHTDTVQEIQSLLAECDVLYFRLGGLLSQLRDDRRDRGLRFDRDYVKREFGLGYGTAMYLIRIYEWFNAAGIEEHWLHGLDWSKAKEIARLPPPKLRTHFDRLSAFARGRTRQKLIEHVQERFKVDRRRLMTG